VDSLPLIVAGIVVPLMAFVGNIVLRAGRGVAQSAASDLLLLVLVFDASVVIASDEFRPLIRDAAMRTAGRDSRRSLVAGARRLVTRRAARRDKDRRLVRSPIKALRLLVSYLAMALFMGTRHGHCIPARVGVHAVGAAMGDVVTTATMIAIANAILLPLAAYGCVRLGLLPGVTWYWPFQRHHEDPAPRHEPRQRAAALGRRSGTP
jgi:hypothetical protein